MKKYLLFGPLCPIGKNLGDEAYLLGCIENMQDGKILLLLSKKDNLDFLKRYKNIDFLVAEKGQIIRNIFIFLRFSGIGRLDKIYHVGADCLDGKWGKMPTPYMVIFFISICIARETDIISFSFTKTLYKRNKFILRYLARYAHFYPRDSISMKNIKQEYCIKNIILASDSSFLARREDSVPNNVKGWIKKQKNDGKKIIMVCLAERPSIKNIDIFILKLSTELNSWEGWSVCIVRHLFCHENHLLNEKFLQLISQEKIYINIQDVNIVRRITKEMDLVVSCLLHCGLGAIAMCKPVMVLDYFGKATHLFNDLNLQDYTCHDEVEFIPKITDVKNNLKVAGGKIQTGFQIGKDMAMKIFHNR